ncbi:MAG: hypothetical protein J1F31_02250 [Erysipelotrichales bacterium]|nr:hypothetical protein [Erysipelotrichales bacterium]
MQRNRDNYNTTFSLIIEYHDNEKNFDLISSLFNDKIVKYSNENNAFYWFILHDRDNDDNGDLKRPHYHLILKHQVRIDKTTLIRRLSLFFGINESCITADGIYTLNGSLRYLTHLDNKDKFQYTEFEVSTNNDGLYNLALKNNCDLIDINYLIEVCRNSTTLLDVMRVLGIETYNKWRNVVKDIFGSL